MTKAKTKDTNEYGLDLKGQMILEEYRELLPVFSRLKSLVLEKLGECLQRAGLIVSSLDARVKQEKIQILLLWRCNVDYRIIDLCLGRKPC